MTTEKSKTDWFVDARFGMFIHFGLYSLQGRGEWSMCKEKIMPQEYSKLANDFNPEQFDADYLCALAKRAGMKYVVFTTMHHDGFRMYDSELTDYCSTKSTAKRDFVAEIIAAARKHGLKIGLYHSLNNWYDQPDGVAALEDKQKYDIFIKNTFARIKELVSKYNPIDILWYDGWWPFDSDGWQAEKMNAMVSDVQPNIIFNGRNGLPGDFSTPEGHISAPSPWRPWEACMTLNDNWGYHKGDNNWKTTNDVIKMLTSVASGKGDLLLNIGPRGDGSIPEPSVKVLEELGDWMEINREAVFNTDIFDIDLNERLDKRGDWCHHGTFTASGNNLFLIVDKWMGDNLVISGLEQKVEKISILGNEQIYDFIQEPDRLLISGLPETAPVLPATVIKVECNAPPSLYVCGGMRTPEVPHPRYDPCPSDIG